MKIPLFYVDAFTSEVFKGNPAAMCMLESWLPDEILQSIAAEHNLSETAFIVKKDDVFQIKWFTPKAEAFLCGHATLATAHVLFKIYNYGSKPIRFESKSGILSVTQASDGFITLDFPAYELEPTGPLPNLAEILGVQYKEMYNAESRHLFVALNSEKEVLELRPDFRSMSELQHRSVLVSAPGNQCDYVLRYFAPKVGVNEDPVTGSAQCSLIPYWSQRLNKKKLISRQLSERGGEIHGELSADNRVRISGNAIIYMQGTINISIKPQNTLIPFTFENKK
ncbi:MAG TPA: PhzF family phenazine biosynthesis protein [Bacteroidales bacterium]|nr:PhzF family phenazine biosynthesis protein [Bacteroidales bacterium]